MSLSCHLISEGWSPVASANQSRQSELIHKVTEAYLGVNRPLSPVLQHSLASLQDVSGEFKQIKINYMIISLT